MHRHSRVSQHGLGAGGGHGYVAAAVGQGVADVVELAVLLLVFHLQVGQGGGAAGTPVDNALVAVNQALVVQVDEGGADGPGRPRVQGEAQAGPVAGGAQSLVLLVNGVAVAGHPLPDTLLELLTAQVVAVGPLLGQQAFHHPLGGNAGVVLAGEPQGVVPQHAVPASQCVLDGGGEGVAQVQLSGDVGRRHDDDEGFAAFTNLRREVTGILPVLVYAPLHGGGIVGSGHFGGGAGGHWNSPW